MKTNLATKNQNSKNLTKRTSKKGFSQVLKFASLCKTQYVMKAWAVKREKPDYP